MLMILFTWRDCDAFLCAMYGIAFEWVAYPFCVTVIVILKKHNRTLHRVNGPLVIVFMDTGSYYFILS